ncbi:MAG: tetratricopeptide repeat protein [Kofleriaceae bacterium]|nr:tetratricopeptide repeat protein [Kofleriaceae bacterium]
MKLPAKMAMFAVLGVAVPLLTAIAPPSVLAQPQQAEDDSVELVREGRAALRDRAYDRAARALDQSLALNPRRIEAYILRAAVHAAQKQYVAGVAIMRKAAVLAPNDIDVRAALGTQLVLAGQPSEGVTILETVVTTDPQRYDASLLLGHTYYQAERWRDATTAYQRYFATRPVALAGDDAIHRVDLADAFLRARQPGKAVELFAASVGSPKVDLRARMGVAWATAALDCQRARPMLAGLNAELKKYPEIGLVDGQCALAIADIDGAVRRAREYLTNQPRAGAAGHALLGEALAARGELAAALAELEIARTLEPDRRRWTVRLATVLRKSGKAGQAIQLLDQLGPPATASTDPEWWLELGESLLSNGQAAAAVTRLSTVQATLHDDGRVLTVLGLAHLRTGQLNAGVEVLEAALAVDRTVVRSKRVLAAALTERGAVELEKAEFAPALATLQRARELGSSPVILRNLGIALLALGRDAEARDVLSSISKPDAVDLLLLARAHSNQAAMAVARDFYARSAANAKGALAVTIAVDAAAAEIEFGEPSNAVTLLDRVASTRNPNDVTGANRATLQAALLAARSAAGIAAIQAGNGSKAVELLRDGAAANASIASKCELALAHVVAGDRDAALRLLRLVAGKPCPFPAPADVQAVPILEAYLDGLTPRRAVLALDRLTKLTSRASGASAVLLATATRVIALTAAADAFRNGNLIQAKKLLAQAGRVSSRVGTDELAVNLAIIDLAEGRLDAALQTLEKLATKVPDALVSVGLIYERRNEASKALDAWRRARRAGVRFAPLADWIETKERVFGGDGAGGSP